MLITSPNSYDLNGLPTTNLSLNTLATHFGKTKQLSSLGSASRYTSGTPWTITSSGYSMSSFRGKYRAPVYSSTNGSYTLQSSPVGFPQGVAGDQVGGFNNYGYDSGGGIFLGSWAGVSGSTAGVNAVTISGTTYKIRQFMYNSTRFVSWLRISSNSGTYTSDVVQNVYYYYASTWYSASVSSSYTEYVASNNDYSRVYLLSTAGYVIPPGAGSAQVVIGFNG